MSCVHNRTISIDLVFFLIFSTVFCFKLNVTYFVLILVISFENQFPQYVIFFI